MGYILDLAGGRPRVGGVKVERKADLAAGVLPSWLTLRTTSPYDGATATFEDNTRPGFILATSATAAKRAELRGPAVDFTQVKKARLDITVIGGRIDNATGKSVVMGFNDDAGTNSIGLVHLYGNTFTEGRSTISSVGTWTRTMGYHWEGATKRHYLSIEIDCVQNEFYFLSNDQLVSGGVLGANLAKGATFKPYVRVMNNNAGSQSIKILDFKYSYEI